MSYAAFLAAEALQLTGAIDVMAVLILIVVVVVVIIIIIIVIII